MKYIFLINLFFLSPFAFSQSATFKEIKLRSNPKYYNTKDSTIIYPIVIIKDKNVNKIINDEIAKKIIEVEEKKLTLKKNLIELSKERITNLYYEVTLNKSWLLSFKIYQEGCGVYCSSWYTYFNFDLKTGMPLKIQDLVYQEKLDSFKSIVLANKISFLEKYKKEELKSLEQKEIDSEVYDWAMREVDDTFCIKQLKLDNFFLTSKYIEIADRCEFPHAIQSQEPDYHLQYFYRRIQSFLRPKYQNLLLK